MSVRPHDGSRPPTPPALTEWPDTPHAWGPVEAGWWKRLGEAALPLGTISASDLLVAARACQVSARVDSALIDPDFKPTALNALLRLELDCWKQLGLSPQARRSVAPLPAEEGASGFEDVE